MGRLGRLAFVLAIAACGGGTTKAVAPATAGPTCTAVADAMVGMMMEGKDATQIPDTVEALKTIIRTRCTDDAWTAEARQCLAAMATPADAERCSALLTDAQQANLVRDQRAKFGDGPAPRPDATAPAAEPTPAGAVAPPPPPATPPPKRRAAPRPGDPCDGGE